MSKYTGLALVTGATKPDLENKALDVLAPFTIKILDKQSMDIRGRYFLAIYFSLDPAHERAITKDLEEMALRNGVDLAIDYQSE